MNIELYRKIEYMVLAILQEQRDNTATAQFIEFAAVMDFNLEYGGQTLRALSAVLDCLTEEGEIEPIMVEGAEPVRGPTGRSSRERAPHVAAYRLRNVLERIADKV